MKQLFKIISALIIIFAVFVSFDYLFGISVSHLFKGKSKQEYIMNEKIDNQIVIFGSSRANHHYDTPYLSDSIGIKSFNAGEDGRGLTYQLPLIKNYLEKNTPKIIVLEVFGTLSGDWNDRLSLLYPYVDDYPYIIEVASKMDSNNKYYLKSKLFQNNSNLIPRIKNYIRPFQSSASNGFDPLPIEPRNSFLTIKEDSDPVKENIIEKEVLKEILSICKDKNITVVGVISPFYNSGNRQITSDSLFREYGYHFIDNSRFRLNTSPENYFKDESHMNEYGAREYTKYFYRQLNDSLKLI